MNFPKSMGSMMNNFNKSINNAFSINNNKLNFKQKHIVFTKKYNKKKTNKKFLIDLFDCNCLIYGIVQILNLNKEIFNKSNL